MTHLEARDMLGTRLVVTLADGLPARLDPDRLGRELEREFACFPPWCGPARPGITLALRGRAGSGREAPPPGGFTARVTLEITVRLDPAARRAELVLAGRPRLQEVVLAAWAQAATLARLAGSPRGCRRTSFHAASLAGPAGGILVLGESGAGKTTLSLLLSHGLVEGLEPLAYLGDEDALVEIGRAGAGRLLPLPRRLRVAGGAGRARGLRGESFAAFGSRIRVLARPGGNPAPPPARLAAIVELVPGPGGREPGAAGLVPLPADRLAFALLAALERFPAANAPPGPARELFLAANRLGFELATGLAGSVPGYRLAYTQPQGFEAAARILAELAGATRRPERAALTGPGSPRRLRPRRRHA